MSNDSENYALGTDEMLFILRSRFAKTATDETVPIEVSKI
jgi:hypothetical protein